MKKLKILFDYSPACRDDKTGIPIFVKHLYTALTDIEDIEVHKTVCISDYIPRRYWKIFRFFEKIIYQKFYLPFKLLWGKYDVYVENQYMYYPLFKPKNILVVNFLYDISLILFDELQTPSHTQNWRDKLPRSIENSDLIMTISKSSKRDIEQYLKDIIKIDKPVEYIYADTDTFKSQNIDPKNTFLRFGIDEDYFLYLGTLEPRKNPRKTIEAFHIFKTTNESTIKLVFAGKKGWLYDDVIHYIEAYHLENDVIFTGYVSDEEKFALLQNTRAFLFLSMYEGFGMPVLEALHYGVPVLASNIDVFHELYADNILYTDPSNIEQTAKMMKKTSSNPPIINKKLFNKFSWEDSARKFIDIIRKAS